jgi:DNA-binding HxlR family transcriptional regulator
LRGPFAESEGRRKLAIFFHLFGDTVLRFSKPARTTTAISQKMLIQQLQQMEAHGIVRRMVHHPVPPTVDYCPTDWGHALCSAFDAHSKLVASRDPLAIPPAGGPLSRGVE